MESTVEGKQREMLLRMASADATAAYLTTLVNLQERELCIKTDVELKGKGLFSVKACEVGDLILLEDPLVAGQHTASAKETLVCSHCFRFVGSVELQIAHRLLNTDLLPSAGVDRNYVERLALGQEHLPYSDRFQLPAVVTCQGGCSENMYCSGACAAAAWEHHHCMLCLGPESPLKAEQREALKDFLEHAASTNDIFIVAAKILANTLTRASTELKKLAGSEKRDARDSEIVNQALQSAWLPYAVGWKAKWWETVTVPDDVDDGCAFRKELQDLAHESLTLLRGALYDERFPGLFSLDVYGSIIGMFELNNIAIIGPSPVEDYLLFIHMDQADDISREDREAARKITGPLLDVLETVEVACEGTAFYPLQSCLNHSCCPNAHAMKRDEDVPGTCVILAKEPIAPGDEILISYIDENEDYVTRQRALEDYGFVCSCPKCLAEGPEEVC